MPTIAPINFKANYIKHTTVQKKGVDNKYHNNKASFVEIDPKNNNDVQVLGEVAESWGKGYKYNTYASDIYEAARLRCNDGLSSSKGHIYAITNQKSNFEVLDPNEVLGVAKFNENKYAPGELEYLQVNPLYKRDVGNRSYQHIGSSMLKSLKSMYRKIGIKLFAVQSAVDFYKSNGFGMAYPFAQSGMIWNPRRK